MAQSHLESWKEKENALEGHQESRRGERRQGITAAHVLRAVNFPEHSIIPSELLGERIKGIVNASCSLLPVWTLHINKSMSP